jgi:uncharacterized membrane protein
MYCPNCGNENSAEQKFCRSCGLGLEKVVQSLTEQLPTRKDETLAQRKQRFERLGVAALSVFGFGVLSFILYSVFYKLMISQGKVWAGLGILAVLIMLGSGLLSVILFAKANEVKEEAASKRELKPPTELTTEADTRELLPEGQPAPIFSVADRTTDLLAVKPMDDKKGS